MSNALIKSYFIFLLFFIPLIAGAEEIIDGDTELEQINSLVDNKDNEVEKQYIDKIQKTFFYPKRSGNENTEFIKYKKGMSYKIRTREAMATILVFENDEIQKVINGDTEGFEIENAGANVLAIKPKIIGIDTNITIIGKSKEVYNFYVFSTNHKNGKNPTLIAFIQNPRLDKNKIGESEENVEIFSHPLSKFYKLPKGRTIDEFMVIGDNTNRLLIDRKKISPIKYEQKAKAKIKSKSGSIYIEDDESKGLKAIEIFNDNEFTYFKFNRNLASSRFPAVFQVINGRNAIVNISVVGDYLIAKTISDKWVFKEGQNVVYIKAIK
ncbi:hypothetical protein HpCK38_17790 [Helicobacter pylori]